MATINHFNVSTANVTTIAAIDVVGGSTSTFTVLGSPKFVTMCNRDADGSDCTVELYSENSDGTSIHYILHDVVIPGGATLVLEQPELNYDSTIYKLQFKLTTVAATQLVDIKVEH